MSFRLPTTAPLSQRFGADFQLDDGRWYYKQVLGYQGHNGNDYATPVGSPVYAADEGTVTFEGWGQNHSWMASAAGICVLINHGGLYGGYAHLSSTVVNKGQTVVKGQLIGYSGSTGAATGPHTHFEAIPLSPNFRNGYAGRIDPNPYIETAAAPAPGGNKDMTPEFIKRTYYMINNQVPTQGEIDFHMQKSTPASFVNGFGDRPLWLVISGERDTIANQLAEVTRQRNEAAAARDAAQVALGNSHSEVVALTDKIASYDQAIADLNTQLGEKDSKLKQLQDAAATPARSLDSYSLGELLVAAFQKTFKIK